MGFLTPDIKVVQPPKPPEIDDQAVADARRRAQERVLLSRRGRSSTVLTGGAGVSGPAPGTGKRLFGE